MEKIRIGYQDTDKKMEVEIYGINFEINSKELEEVDTKNINDNLDEIIEKILGEGALEKINAKRKEDGHEEADTQVKLTIITFLVETYVNVSISPINNMVDRTSNKYKNIDRKVNNIRGRKRYRRY